MPRYTSIPTGQRLDWAASITDESVALAKNPGWMHDSVLENGARALAREVIQRGHVVSREEMTRSTRITISAVLLTTAEYTRILKAAYDEGVEDGKKSR